MRAILLAAAFLTGLGLAACASAPRRGGTPAVTSASLAVTSTASVISAPTPEPAAPPTPSAGQSSSPIVSAPRPQAVPDVPPSDLLDSPGDARLATAASSLQARKHAQARGELRKIIAELDGSATRDVRMAAHALLGRACEGLKDDRCAREQYGIVRAAWQDSASAVRELESAGGDEPAKQARVRRALEAYGEALFKAAEEKRLAAEKPGFPAYQGKADAESIKKHVATKVRDWMVARKAALTDAEHAYMAVVDIQPQAPPRWVVASASSVGAMWGRFVADFRAAPVPREWLGSGMLPGTKVPREEVRRSFSLALDQATEPQREQARAAFRYCQNWARKYAIADEHAKTCDAWLQKDAQADPAPGPAP